MTYSQILDWLLEGDIAIQYQVYRDLLGIEKNDLKNKIEKYGWGAKFLSFRLQNGHWGKSFYQPKWISTHYTLLDLKNLGIRKTCPQIKESIKMILGSEKAPDGGLKPISSLKVSDVCINGMAMNYLSYFKADSKDMESIVDFLLSQWMPDGGFNCYSNRIGATHSSLHTTLSVIEGIWEYSRNGYTYRINELLKAAESSRKFILLHELFKSHRTGVTIDSRMLRFPFPSRWRYDILRALDYFQFARIKYDPRIKDALNILLSKKREDGRWNLYADYPGQVHFQMEKAGEPSRWNTLRALRVLNLYDISNIS